MTRLFLPTVVPPTAPGTSYSATVLAESGLVAYWRLGEASGNPQDSKGTNHVTVVGGSPTYGVTGAITGDSNKAVTFNGSTGYFSAPDANPLDLGDGPLSIECWAKRSSTGTWDMMVAKSGGGYLLGINSSDHFFLGKSGLGAIYTETNVVQDTDWHHYVGTKNGASVVLYRDGYSVAMTGTNATLVNTSNALEIGTYVSGGDYFAGTIDEVALYNVVLTGTQVLNHYTIGTTGGGGGGGTSVTVYSPSAMMAALDDTSITEIVLADGTYNLEAFQYGWLDINGEVHSGYKRTSANAVLVRAESDGGVTFDGLGTRRDWGVFRGGASYQEWRGFKLKNYGPWDDGMIGFGGGNYTTPSHHITLRNWTVDSSNVVGAGPGPNYYTNGHLVYFQQAAGGGTHDILIDGLVSSANVAAQFHFYHDELDGPGTNLVIRNCTLNLNHQTRTLFGFQSWTSELGTVLVEDVTITGANDHAFDHNYNGTWTLRRVTSTGSTNAGFYSTQGTYPSVTGFTFDSCSFA